MTRLSLVLRNLKYFRAANAAVIAGMAVATAVLTGALMVGDSVRGSLRDLAVERLGKVDYALSGNRFFNESLAKRVQDASPGFQVQPGVLIRGGAADEDASHATAGVQIGAIEGSFAPVERGKAVINSEIATALSLKAGGTALLRLPIVADAPRDAALTKRSASDVLSGMRVAVDHVESQSGFLTNFTLEGSQRVPRNAWVALPELQDAIGQQNRVNLLLASGTDAVSGDGVKALNEQLRKAIQLSDYGLSVKPSADGKEAVLNSESTYIDTPVSAAAQRVANEMKSPLKQVSVYLLNSVAKVAANEKSATQAGDDAAKMIHYAVAAGISDVDGQTLAANEVTLNEWAAKQIDARVGDKLRLTYYLRQAGGHLAEVASDRPGVGIILTVVKILPMSGLGADPTLTPEYKGLTDKQSFSDWKPPEGMVIDRKLSDEPYWNKYRAAPKLLVNLETAHKLWGGTFGDITSLRIPAEKSEAFAAKLRDAIDPANLGMVFQPIRAQQLAAAVGGTDFSLYFVMFSFFLIVAAALLVAMLFRLNIEQRARQIGVQSAVGFSPRALRRMALQEGMLLAVVGGVIGLLGALGYSWLMVAGLRTWWVGAVGTTAMHLHVEPTTLIIGLISSLAVAFVAILWAVWHVGKVSASRLLAGGWHELASKTKKGWISWGIAIVCGVCGLGLVASGAAGAIDPQGAFMGGGAALLIASLAAVAALLRPRVKPAGSAGGLSVSRLGVRNASRNTSRSVLSVGLIAFAAFTLVTVAALKEGVSEKTRERNSSTGGYSLMIQSDIPLLADPGTPQGRKLLEINAPDEALWNDVAFAPMRSWQGQDISCLNLTKPNTPNILAVSHSMVERGGFVKDGSPLKLLEAPIGDDGTVPVIADAETAEYILKLGIGDTMPLTDQLGNPRKLKLVATLPQSLFQSEMLMGEANFRKLFPSQAGFGMVLVDVRQEHEEQVRKVLATALEQNAAVVDRTADRLARYAQVKNTYLSTFQTLGSLGLMLGTIGLAVVLLRSIVERRSELALLAAIGFARESRLKLVLSENAFLLVLGLIVGTGCAMLGVAPEVFSSHRTVNIGALALTLVAVLLIGLASLVLAVWIGQRNLAPADLRSE